MISLNRVDRISRTLDTALVRLKLLIRRQSVRGLWLPVLALVAALAPAMSEAAAWAAEASHCDPSLAPSANYPFKYINRGDRCEGVYIQLVGSTTLTMLSFTSVFGAFDAKTAQPLVIGWTPAPGTGEVQLRALTTRQHLYYRMDTRVRAGESRYRWPTDVLAAMGFGR